MTAVSLKVNQICACFNDANRLLSELGVTLEDGVVGFYVDEAEAHRR
ncbi:MAG: hypothetical protein GDA49_08510 [Rhodospirillales bacterium]|nr:hypothetical protein [Rhodospirillales bacterium]